MSTYVAYIEVQSDPTLWERIRSRKKGKSIAAAHHEEHRLAPRYHAPALLSVICVRSAQHLRESMWAATKLPMNFQRKKALCSKSSATVDKLGDVLEEHAPSVEFQELFEGRPVVVFERLSLFAGLRVGGLG